MKIYGLKNCDSTRAARKALPDAEFVDVREDGLPADVLTAALETFHDSLLNTSSTTWRELDETERKKAPVHLIATYPALMKRPLIEKGGSFHLGWNDTTRSALGV